MPGPVNISLTNGNLGRVAPPADGISGLIVSGIAVGGQFALGDVLGPFVSIQEVEAKGITAAYDIANDTNAHLHCQEFFNHASAFGGRGQQLYVMVAAKTVSMEDLCDKTEAYAKKMLDHAAGKIRLLGITRVPNTGYTPAYTAQLEDDMWAAIVKLKALYTDELALNRPFDALIEARNWQGTVSSTQDLRDASTGPGANMVSIVLGQTKEMNDLGADVTEALLAASVGAALGSASALPVQRNLGRIKNGPVFTSAGFTSDGEPIGDLTEALVASLVAKGYVFFRTHDNRTGVYWSGDANAVRVTDDYANKHRSRPIHKVVRIAQDVYLDDYLDDIKLDPETGRMDVSVVKSFQERIIEQVDVEMTTRGELSGMGAFCDPAQNVLANDTVAVQLLPVPKGMVNAVNVTVGYSTGLNA